MAATFQMSHSHSTDWSCDRCVAAGRPSNCEWTGGVPANKTLKTTIKGSGTGDFESPPFEDEPLVGTHSTGDCV